MIAMSMVLLYIKVMTIQSRDDYGMCTICSWHMPVTDVVSVYTHDQHATYQVACWSCVYMFFWVQGLL